MVPVIVVRIPRGIIRHDRDMGSKGRDSQLPTTTLYPREVVNKPGRVDVGGW